MSLRTTIALAGGSLSRDICSFCSRCNVSFLECIFTNQIINYKHSQLFQDSLFTLCYHIYNALNHNNFMRKLYKWLTIANLSIQLDEHNQAKDISRARISIFDDGSNQRVHASKHYANIKDNKLQWDESIEFQYTGQTRLTFQTECEHQYGYDLQQLKVIYSGLYYLRNEMFFRPDFCHVYSPEGEKKGILKLTIKIQTKQEEPPVEAEPQAAGPIVREDLIGLIKINNGSLQITNSSFSRKRYPCLTLKLLFGTCQHRLLSEDGLKWPGLAVKFEYIQNGPELITVELLEDEKIILEGSVECSAIQKQMRFTTLKVSLFSRSGIKIGSLVLEYRYLAKQQLLDLIYSPTNKLTSTGRSQSGGSLAASPFAKPLKLSSRRRSDFATQSRSRISPANRYKIGYLMNRNSDILIPKAARFEYLKSTNKNVSYIDPERSSDFFPKPQKGPSISKSSKFDFTRPFRSNPGVGEYKLPSIWSKY